MSLQKVAVLVFAFASLFISGCNSGKKGNAEARLKEAVSSWELKDYNRAKLLIDSIETTWPDQISVIAEGKKLLTRIELAEQLKSYAYFDSLLTLRQEEYQALLKNFTIEEPEFAGKPKALVYKHLVVEKSYTRAYLKANLYENGEFYLVSRYTGTVPLHHTAVTVTSADGSATTLTVPENSADNYHFSDGGQIWETVSYRNNSDNGVAQFILTHKNEPLKVSLVSKGNYGILFSEADKTAIIESFRIAQIIRTLNEINTNMANAYKRSEALKRTIESYNQSK